MKDSAKCSLMFILSKFPVVFLPLLPLLLHKCKVRFIRKRCSPDSKSTVHYLIFLASYWACVWELLTLWWIWSWHLVWGFSIANVYNTTTDLWNIWIIIYFYKSLLVFTKLSPQLSPLSHTSSVPKYFVLITLSISCYNHRPPHILLWHLHFSPYRSHTIPGISSTYCISQSALTIPVKNFFHSRIDIPFF